MFERVLMTLFSVSLHSYFLLLSAVSHCSLARGCSDTGFTTKREKGNEKDIHEQGILAFPREMEQDKTLCYNLGFFLAL